MKKIAVFLIFVATLISCEKVDFDPVLKDLPETKSGLIMKAGSYRSDIGTIQVESKVATGFYLESKDPENPLVSAAWNIEGIRYSGLTVFHKFAIYPDFHKTSILVTAKFADGKTETRKFDLEIVKSIKDSGPLVIIFEPQRNGSGYFWFLWDRRWLWGYGLNDSTWSINGSIVDWKLTTIQNEYCSINEKGWPVKDVAGKYLSCKISGKSGSNTIVLVSPDNIWVDITGSIYVKDTGEPGLAYFKFEDGKISNEYEEWKEDSLEFPGKTGDNYFRFNQTPDTLSGKTSLFFKLDTTWNALAFARQEKPGGSYSEAVGLKEVEGFPNWGSLEISLEEITGNVSGWRYGPDMNKPENYAKNMELSYFYDESFNSIRLFLVQLYQ